MADVVETVLWGKEKGKGEILEVEEVEEPLAEIMEKVDVVDTVLYCLNGKGENSQHR
jgi:hypothetical protein